jgi:chromosome segregation ATPase
VRLQEEVIEDITGKIRLLEDAIEEHERSLTSRDHLMEEYEQREKDYLAHIDGLEQTIQELLKGRSNDNLDGVFHQLNTEFNKEKDYYLAKMKEYEDLLNNERTHYRHKIKELEEEVLTYRSQHSDKGGLYTLNESSADVLCDRSHKDNARQGEGGRRWEESRQKMEMMVSRIEESKVRIGKSACKLTEFLH